MTGVGRIFKRGKWWHVAFYRYGRQIRKPAGTTSESKARKFLSDQMRLAQVGREDRITFSDLTALVIADYDMRGLRSKYDLEKSRLPHLNKAFKGFRAIDLTTARLKRYASERKNQGAANGTINRELGVVKRAFRLAVQDGLLTTIPYVQMLPETTVREGFVSHAEFLAISGELKSDVLRDVTEFLYLSGWRLREALTLEWSDVDRDTIRLRAINSKTGNARSIPSGGEVMELIARRRTLRRLDCRFVFHADGAKLHRGSVSRTWRKAAERAKCVGIMIHDLRRSAARNLVRAGVPERVVMTMLGHRTRSMLDRYNIVSDSDLTAAQVKLGVYLSSQARERSEI